MIESVTETRIIDPERVDVYYRPVPGSRGRRVVARNIPTSTLEPLLQKLSEKYAVPVESFEWTPTEPITEAFDQPYAIQWTKQNGDWHATADLDDGSELVVLFMSQGDNQWMVEFERDENMEITGEGDAQRVFATVLTAMQQFIAKRKPAMLNFSAEKEDDPTGSRARLYDRMIQRYITGTGYDLTRKDYPGGATYTLTKQVQGVAEDAENFNGIGISMEVEGDEIMVRATAGGRELGHVLFVEDGEYLMPQDLEVEERFQGQGIAAAMYDYVKSKGYKIRRSGQQTDAGAGFWRKNRGEENVWENFADGKGSGRPGDSQRHGIPKGATMAQLEKAAKAPGRKGQLARWQLNMRRGRKK
jgi:GNAT superfamily N-acetyltransferase